MAENRSWRRAIANSGDNGSIDIGRSIRLIRTEAQLGLREASRRAGITPSLLSQIETGKANPSVETLFKLAPVLNVPVARFLTPPATGVHPKDDDSRIVPDGAAAPDRMFVADSDRRPNVLLGTGIHWTSLTGTEQPGIRFIEVSYPPGATSAKEMLRHPGRDYLVVIEGEVVVQLDEVKHVLTARDALWFNASVPHQIRNESTTSATIIAVTVDPWPPAR